MADPGYTGYLKCIWEFQTLITGGLAVLGAMFTALVIYKSASLPVEAERVKRTEDEGRKLRIRSLEISEEMDLLIKRASQCQGTVKVHKAANTSVSEDTKQKMRLRIPLPIDDWEIMSLLPEQAATNGLHLKGLIEDHNFDIDRAGGAFGDDNFGQSIVDRLNSIQHAAGNFRLSVLEASNS